MPAEASLFLQSLLIGLSIAAPVGPIGLLVIQRTLQHGAASGLATGMGAAVADAVYGAVGAFGVSVVMSTLQAARTPLALAGAAVLLWLAWRTWRAPVAQQAASIEGGRHLAGAFGGTFFLTLSNPATVFSFIAIFASLGAGSSAGASTSPWTMIAGVFIGSALWWGLLCGGVSRLRHVIDGRWRRRINRVAAAMLAAFALWTLLTILPVLAGASPGR